MHSIKFIFKIIISGSSEVISENELFFLILKKKQIVIKTGFDPTTTNLHLGHLVILNKLKQCQELGYFIYFLIGDFTAMIGDPSGKNSSRKQLSKNEVLFNYKTYNKQILKILNPSLTKIYFNSTWFDLFNSYSFLELMSLTTVSKLMERNDFKIRYDSNKSINLTEIIYPILQGYDSVFIQSDIEIGGIDQKLNFLLARDLQKKYNQKSQVSIMMPILLGLDGKDKMSKSLNNCINLNDNAYDMFCKVMSISDILMKGFFKHLFFFSDLNYDKKLIENKNPMYLKYDLAIRIVSLLHNKKLANDAKQYFYNRFSKKILTDDIKLVIYKTTLTKITLFEILLHVQFVSSKSDFKRFLKTGSIKINGKTEVDKLFFFDPGLSYFLQIGKKKLIKLLFTKH